MVVGPHEPLSAEGEKDIGQPAGTRMYGEAEFGSLLDELVALTKPRLFAVVQVYGERVNGEVAAWGMAFEDHVEVIGAGGTSRSQLVSPERAVRSYEHGEGRTAHLVWADPEPVRPSDAA